MKESVEMRGKLALRNKMEEEEHSRDARGLREEIGIKTYIHGPMDYAKTLKPRIREWDLDLPER